MFITLDVRVYRGAVRGMSDHYLAEGKVRAAERWRPIRGVTVGQMHIKVRELRKKQNVLEYQKIRSGWESVEGMERQWVEEKWGDLKLRALEGEAEVCGYCKIEIGMRKGSEWWNGSVNKVVEGKKKLFEEWVQRQNGRLWERYGVKRRDCEWVVNVAKREVRWRLERKLTEAFVMCDLTIA